MPSDIDFLLPDGMTNVSIRAPKHAGEDGTNDRYEVNLKDVFVGTWIFDKTTTTRVSPAQVLDERAEKDIVRRFEPSESATDALSRRDSGTTGDKNIVDSGKDRASIYETTWVSIYALWLLLQELDVIAVAFPVDSPATKFVTATGLAAPSPFEPSGKGLQAQILLLAREAFWQGAGAPDRFDWLRVRPEANIPGFNGRLGAFASQMSFTRQGNVCTTHPLRPPKPAAGTVLYSRFIVELGQQLKIVHIDALDSTHFQSYARWQNSDRVNHGWKERGPDSKHRAYLESQHADLHTMSCIFLWDDEPAGYCEVGWAKEDNTACFVSSNCNINIGEFDQNSHILVGEEKFRGGKRYQAVATSIKHLCFLRDPRTQQVIAEPRSDLPSVPIQARFLPQERKKRVQLPHKQAVLFALQRDRFLQEAHFY